VNPRIRLAALFLCLLPPWAAGAEVKISLKDRIHNRPPGRCGWCALETLARHHGIKALYGLTRRHPTRSDADDLEEALIKARVPYRIQYPGKRSTKILKAAIKAGRGAAVGFRERRSGAGGHIVTLVDIGSKEVRLIDPSAPQRVRTMPLKRFLYWWDGLAVVLEKRQVSRVSKKANSH
jgi:hypothetical protein